MQTIIFPAPLILHETENTRKIGELVDYLREHESRFRREVARVEADLAKAA